MSLEIELKAPDIATSLAIMYGVDQKDVYVGTETECRGYGLNEHDVHVPFARISIKDPDMIRKLMEAAKAKEDNHE